MGHNLQRDLNVSNLARPRNVSSSYLSPLLIKLQHTILVKKVICHELHTNNVKSKYPAESQNNKKF